jgi:peptidoglycan/LPS O-acetylase OafA/YrhL
MTELRRGAAMAAVTPPFERKPSLRPMLLQGVAGLVLGAVLTVGAVAWSQGVLGFLGLMTVLGSLAWISLGVVRHYAGRLRRS